MEITIFESIKHINKFGSEYWHSRELAKALNYSDYRNFENIIQKAKTSCQNSKQDVKVHFGEVTAPQNSRNQYREIQGQVLSSTILSRYACYLIAQNADPKKEEVALAQTYFAIQTHKQELHEQLVEDSKRVFLRSKMTEHNKQLAQAAKDAGVTSYAIFQDFGYMGLYGGLRQKDIHLRKRLSSKQSILDHMASEELAANLFRATQAESKLKREHTFGQDQANDVHFNVGKKVRKTISELGGAMPEELPPVESIKESKKRPQKKSDSKLL